MSFCTAITCMDGRTHLAVIEYLKRRFGVQHVDLVTEPGVVGVLGGAYRYAPGPIGDDIHRCVSISIEAHASAALAIVAHADCAGNPVDEPTQKRQLKQAVDALRAVYPELEIAGLWLGESWQPEELYSVKPLSRPRSQF